MASKKEKLEEINPFVINSPIRVIHVTDEKVNAQTSKDGIVYEGSVVKKNYYMTEADKISLFKPSASFSDKLLFTNLTSKSRDLFFYILFHLPKNQDYIQLKKDKVSEVLKMSRNTFFQAVKELKIAGVITVKSQSLYWINPVLFFNGDVIGFYVKKVGEEALETVNKIRI